MSSPKSFEPDAFDLRLGGRYSLANRRDLQGQRREFACRTTRVSPQRMLISVPVLGAVGERVISYFGEFGKLEGLISGVFAGGFMVDLVITHARREQLAGKLPWLDRRQREAVADARAQARIVPENPHSSIVLADGSTTSCSVIDMSVSGAAVACDLRPDIGTPLAIGRTVGRVVRHRTEGFAVKFIALQDASRLERMVIRGW